jgi:hypothetical protein
MRGWASLAEHDDYKVTVHLILGQRVLASTIADEHSMDAPGSRTGFSFDIEKYDLRIAGVSDLDILIGETDEYLRIQDGEKSDQNVKVEDLLHAKRKRNWVSGETYREALEFGLSDEDIVDLLYIDILGRPADPNGSLSYLRLLRTRQIGYDGVRKALLGSDEYRERAILASEACGAIFSDWLLRLVGEKRANKDKPSIARFGAPQDPGLGDRSFEAFPSNNVRTLGDAQTVPRQTIRVTADAFRCISGWHKLEWADRTPFRWMCGSAILATPMERKPVSKIQVELCALHGSDKPKLRGFFDDEKVDVVSVRVGNNFIVSLSAHGGSARPVSELRLESQVSGCPLTEGSGDDDRELSLCVQSVTYFS